jgi:hypothetical protein
MRRGLIAVLCLLATTPAEFAQTAPTTRGQISAYTVDGLALGERVQSNDAGYREYKCAPSDQFDGFTWCQKSRHQRERRRSFNTTYSLLHSRDGRVVYVNRFQAPAFFGPKEADEDIQQYSHRLGVNAGAKMHRLAGTKIHQCAGEEAPHWGLFRQSSGLGRMIRRIRTGTS